jgi:hypothetical protein
MNDFDPNDIETACMQIPIMQQPQQAQLEPIEVVALNQTVDLGPIWLPLDRLESQKAQ